MFGVNKKLNKIIVVITLLIGITVFSLSMFEILKPVKTFNLLGILIMLIAVWLYLRPIAKRLKNVQLCVSKYREGFYKEITKNNELPKGIDFIINDKNMLSVGDFCFDELTYQEAIEVSKILIEDFIIVAYGVLDEKKHISSSKIENFKVTVTDKDNNYKEKYMIKDYKFIK